MSIMLTHRSVYPHSWQRGIQSAHRKATDNASGTRLQAAEDGSHNEPEVALPRLAIDAGAVQ